MKTLLFHLTGNANVKAVAEGLVKSDQLYEYHVTLAAFAGSFLYNLGAFKPLSEIRRRSLDVNLKNYTRTWPWLEIARILALKGGIKSLTGEKGAPLYIDTLVQKLDEHVASKLKYAKLKGVQGVYGYEDTTIHAFSEAKKLGLQCLYDLPIGYWRTARNLLMTEADRWPEWLPTITGLQNTNEELQRKDDELELADQIFVASTFTANTLKDYPSKLAPLHVVPYGFPPIHVSREYRNQINKPLRLLFVGSLSQRKGIADLFAAVDRIGKSVELTVVGQKGFNDCAPLNSALSKHKWIPSMSHQGILELMREHDVLVFPSLFEGFGLVITEAMSQGTPVITTDRTAGPDFIKNDENGWLIDAASTDSLQAAIEHLIHKPNRIAEIGREAMRTAENRPWDIYSNQMGEIIKKL